MVIAVGGHHRPRPGGNGKGRKRITDSDVRHGVDVMARYGAELEPFIQTGVLRHEGPRLWLTRQGMLIAHEIMITFV